MRYSRKRAEDKFVALALELRVPRSFQDWENTTTPGRTLNPWLSLPVVASISCLTDVRQFR